MTDNPHQASHLGRHGVNRQLRFATGRRIVGLCLLSVLFAHAANAAPLVRCVAVRKPTAQQREQSAADVERLLDDYETKTNDYAAWQVALTEVFDRFPLPSVNGLVAQHHPAWAAPEQKLIAYLEATRQDPDDYAEPAAVALTIQRIRQTLLPEVQRGPILVIEARGAVRRQDLAKLDVRVDDQSCSGELIAASETYSISWTDADRKLSVRAAPQRLPSEGLSCIAIDGDQIGPCDGQLTRATAPIAPSPSAERLPNERSLNERSSTEHPSTEHPSTEHPSTEHPSTERVRRAPSHSAEQPTHPSAKSPAAQPSSAQPSSTKSSSASPPSIDYALAVPGLALAAAGLTVAVVARVQVDSHMERAQRGPDPQCQDGLCTPAGMAEVLAARDWATGYYVAGAASLLGLGAMLASGHHYYAHWLSGPSKVGNDRTSPRAPSVTLLGVRAGVGVLVQRRF